MGAGKKVFADIHVWIETCLSAWWSDPEGSHGLLELGNIVSCFQW